MKRFRIANAGKNAICFFLLTAILLVSLVPSDLPFVAPRKAEAFFGCPPGISSGVVTSAAGANAIPAVPIINLGLFTVNAQAAVNTGNVSDRKCYLDFIVKTLSKAVVHALVSSIIDWINRGFEGGPTFVTDPEGFFGNIADQEIGRMIDGSALGFVCDPFRLQIQFGFLQQRSRTTAPSRCSITSIVRNFEGFVGGDFSQGGWPGWISMTSQPQNNPFGSQLMAEEILAAKVTSRQNTAKVTLDWGKGFKSLLSSDGTIKTPGSLINDQLSKATGNELDYLNLAREFDDIVIALANLGISQIMSGGLRK